MCVCVGLWEARRAASVWRPVLQHVSPTMCRPDWSSNRKVPVSAVHFWWALTQSHRRIGRTVTYLSLYLVQGDWTERCDWIPGIHECFMCKKLGDDVRRCMVPACGKFYHGECVASHALTVPLNRGFRCSLHACLACFIANPNNPSLYKGSLIQTNIIYYSKFYVLCIWSDYHWPLSLNILNNSRGHDNRVCHQGSMAQFNVYFLIMVGINYICSHMYTHTYCVYIIYYI